MKDCPFRKSQNSRSTNLNDNYVKIKFDTLDSDEVGTPESGQNLMTL